MKLPMPIKFHNSSPSAFTLNGPPARQAFVEHARTIIGALQESGMDDEAWHLNSLAETLEAAHAPITESSIVQAVARHLRAEGIESQNGQDDPLPLTLIRLLNMAAERVEDA